MPVGMIYLCESCKAVFTHAISSQSFDALDQKSVPLENSDCHDALSFRWCVLPENPDRTTARLQHWLVNTNPDPILERFPLVEKPLDLVELVESSLGKILAWAVEIRLRELPRCGG